MGHPAVGAALLELAQFLRADHQLERSLDLLLDEALPALQSADQTLNRLMAWFEVAELHGLAGHSSAALDAWRTGALPTAIELDDPFWLHAVWDEISTCLSAAGDIGGALDAQCDGALSAARRLDPAGRVTAALPAIRLWLRAAETEAPDAIEQHRWTLIAYVSAALESASAADVDADAVEYLTEWLREARGDALDVDDA